MYGAAVGAKVGAPLTAGAASISRRRRKIAKYWDSMINDRMGKMGNIYILYIRVIDKSARSHDPLGRVAHHQLFVRAFRSFERSSTGLGTPYSWFQIFWRAVAPPPMIGPFIAST